MAIQTPINRNVTAIDMYNVLFGFRLFFGDDVSAVVIKSFCRLLCHSNVTRKGGELEECNSIARVVYQLGDGY